MAYCSNTEVAIKPRVRSATSLRVGELRSPKFHIQYIVYDPTVGRRWESYFADQTRSRLLRKEADG